ncbi:MAG: aspartate aminotransferase family protein [Anaerolineae bacterium]|nr:aspartate aminotransferase family protein [Anaerolineae bacterium]
MTILLEETTDLKRKAIHALWQPFSRPADLEAEGGPVVMDRGEGVWLWDTQGRRYLDGVGALEAMAVGHGRVELVEVAAQQMRKLAFLDVFRYASQPAIELADTLLRIGPSNMARAVFTPGGSEAVEVALKLAFQYHYLRGEPQRRKVICRQGAYHGVTFGAMNCDGHYYSTRTDIYLGEMRFGEVALGPATGPGWGKGARHTAGAEEFRRKVLEIGPQHVAAIIVDPVATASAVAAPPPEDLRKLRALCDEFGILLIADEVIAGFARSGRMFASQRYDVQPDFLTLSKALSSGYIPIGATLVSRKVIDVFNGASAADNVFTHGHTYGGHPVACAVALENIRILEREGLAERAEEIGAYFQRGLESLSHHASFVDARGVGLLRGLELVGGDDKAGRFGSARAACLWMRKRLRDLGLITLTVHPGTVFLLAPPLIIEKSEIDALIDILDRGLDELDRALAG